MKNFLLIITIVLLIFLSSSGVFALDLGGSTRGDGGVSISSPIGTDLLGIIKRIIGWLIGLAIPVAGLLIVIAGYQIMFAAGEPDKVKTGKQTILYTVVGLAIIILAWAFIGIIQKLLGLK